MNKGLTNTAIQKERRFTLRLERLNHLPTNRLVIIQEFIANEIKIRGHLIPDSTFIVGKVVQSILSEREVPGFK